MALIKKQLLAKEDILLSADNTPVSQARAGTTVSVHPVNASVIPYDENRSIAEAIQGVTYTHPLTHPVSIIDGSSNPSKFVKTDALGNTGFDIVTWAEVAGKPNTYTPSAHEHSMAEITSGNLSAARVSITTDRQFITADQLTVLANAESLSNKGQPLGYAPLNSQGKINPQYLGSLSILDVFTPADLPSMLALTAQPGDIAFRLDNNNTYMLIALPASTEANWKQLSNSVGVLSVNGLSGVVSISTDDVPEGAAKYYTDEKVDDRVAALLQAGTNITLTYNDALNTLTISADDSAVVHKTGDETIAGVKTFSSNIVGNITGNSGSATKLQTARTINGVAFDGTASITISDSTAVKKTGNETIDGIKTFSSSPIVPNATTGTQAVNKDYADTKVTKVASTDNAIARFDGTTGELQNSGVIIDDSGNVGINDSAPQYKLSIGQSIPLPSTAGSKITAFSKYTNVGNASFLRFDTVRTSAGSSHDSAEERIRKVVDVTEMGYIGFGYDNVKLGTGSGDKVIIDNEGNVGIGTSSTVNSKFNKTFTTQVTGFSSVAITAGDYSSGAASTVTAVESLGARLDGNGSFGGRFGASYRRTDGEVIQAGTVIGYYAFGGQWGTDVGYVPSKHLYTASICGVSEGTFTSDTAMPTGISFRTGSTGESLGNVNTTYGTERMRIDSAGNVLLTSGSGALGYGAGSGGTVTQLTSKSTAVTLNKPCGQITMASDPIAAGAMVSFVVNCSIFNANDSVKATIKSGVVSYYNYHIDAYANSNGSFVIILINRTGATLAEAVTLNYTIIKGAVA